MLVRFGNSRIDCHPRTGTNGFGGNTSCVEVVTKAGKRLPFSIAVPALASWGLLDGA